MPRLLVPCIPCSIGINSVYCVIVDKSLTILHLIDPCQKICEKHRTLVQYQKWWSPPVAEQFNYWSAVSVVTRERSNNKTNKSGSRLFSGSGRSRQLFGFGLLTDHRFVANSWAFVYCYFYYYCCCCWFAACIEQTYHIDPHMYSWKYGYVFSRWTPKPKDGDPYLRFMLMSRRGKAGGGRNSLWREWVRRVLRPARHTVW